jgi:hypothetical protein
MANFIFPSFKDRLLGHSAVIGTAIDLIADNLKVVLVDTGTDLPTTADVWLSDISAGARVATSGNLAGKSIATGVFDATDPTITAVTGATVEGYLIYKDTGSAATSPLICWVDTTPVPAAISFTPNGGDVVVQFDNGTNRIFKLT